MAAKVQAIGAAVYSNALDHAFDLERMVREVRRVLRPVAEDRPLVRVGRRPIPSRLTPKASSI